MSKWKFSLGVLFLHLTRHKYPCQQHYHLLQWQNLCQGPWPADLRVSVVFRSQTIVFFEGGRTTTPYMKSVANRRKFSDIKKCLRDLVDEHFDFDCTYGNKPPGSLAMLRLKVWANIINLTNY